MRKTVLVVEDSILSREAFHRAIEMGGYNVVEAWDMKSALDVDSAVHPDLILLDLFMPEHDGFETTVALRKQTKAPIVYATAFISDIENIKKRANELGVKHVVSKPCYPEDLLDCIKKEIGDQEL